MVKKIILLAFLYGFMLRPLIAQVSFQKRYGSDSKEYESVANAVASPDGGLVLGGVTESGVQGAFDFFVQKMNPDGTEAWLKSFGGMDNDILSDLIPAAGGGYLFSGSNIDPMDNSMDAVVGRINDNGNLLWLKTYGNAGAEFGMSLCQLTDGRIVLLGNTIDASHQPGLFRAVFDQNGGFVSSFFTQTTDDIAAVKAIATSDGGYLAEITGGNFIFGEPDVLIKYSANHIQQWSKAPTSIGTPSGLFIGSIFDIKASANGLIMALSTSSGVYFAQLSHAGNTLILQKVTDSFGSGAGVWAFPDGTFGVTVVSSKLIIKKLSAAGATLDSVSVTGVVFSGLNPKFVFPDAENLYVFGDLSLNNQNDYAVARVVNLLSPELDWQQTFGESGVPDHEVGTAVVSLPDGGFVLAGSKEDADGNLDTWLVRVNASGNIVWEKTYSLSDDSFDDEPMGSLKLDDDGNIVLFAATDNYQPEYHLLKFSPTGMLIFDKLVVTSDYTPDYFRAIPLPGGGFVSCVTLDYDEPTAHPTIIRLDNNGDVLWTKSYSGRQVNDISALPDGSLVAAGYKNDKPWIFKIDASGNLQWEKNYNVAGFGVINSIGQATDGSIFAGGLSTNLTETTYNAMVIKTNALGVQLWLSEFSKGDGSFWQVGTVLPDASGGACFLGQFFAPPANIDLITSIFRFRTSITQVGADGNMVSDQSFGTDGTYPFAGTADFSPDGQVIFCATVGYGSALQDAWVAKTNCAVSVKTIGTQLEGTIDFAPNPVGSGQNLTLRLDFASSKTLQIYCMDIMGIKLWQKTETVPAGTSRFDLQAPNVAGVYLVQVADEEGGSQTIKVVVQ